MSILAAALASLALAAAQPAAQAAEPPPTEVEGVVVQGGQVEEAVRAFVEDVAAAPRGRNRARWDGRVCIGVVNLAPRYAQAMIDQISAVSLAVGLDVGEPGCRPHVLILADSDGDALASRLVADEGRVFRPDIGASNLGRDALEAFQTSGAPVRWWAVSETVLADSGASASGAVRVRGASRLRSNVREDLRRIIVILDTSRIGTVGFTGLSEYVAMVALAQVDPDVDATAYPTILNLFAGGAPDPNARMTQWDLDYLRALYATRGDSGRRSGEADALVAEILRQGRAEAAGEDEAD